MEQKPSDRSLQEAARWHARLHSPDCSAQDREAFERWLAADRSHAAAYARAEQTAQAASELLGADPRLQALLDAAMASPQESTRATSNVRRWRVPASLVATLLICAFLGLHFVGDGMRASEPARSFATTSTPETILLPDGSTARLDVGTRLTVQMTAQRRFITLESGRAMFEVAHDAARPFAVRAATSRTTALGTKFQVQLDGQQVLVTLTEGSVAVDHEDSTRVWQERLRPGEQLAINVSSAARDKKVVDASVVTSWTRGRLLFRNTRLSDALDEVNRYSQTKVRLGDPTLGDMQVGGNFIAGESANVVDAFAAVLPLRVVPGGDKEIILFRRYDSASH